MAASSQARRGVRRRGRPQTCKDAAGVWGHAVTGGRTVPCAGQTSLDADGGPCTPTCYLTDVDAFFDAQAALTERLRAAGCRATATSLGVTRLALSPLLVEVEATAVTEAG